MRCKLISIKYPLLFLFLSLLTISSAQTNYDSLWAIWNDKSQHDTNRIKAIDKLAWDKYLFTDPDSAIILAKIQFAMATRINSKKWIAEAQNTQGVALWMKGDYIGAVDFFNKSLVLFESMNNKYGRATTLNNIGLVYGAQRDDKRALEFYRKGMEVYEEIGDQYGIAMSLNNMGSTYDKINDDEAALNCFRKSLSIMEGVGDEFGLAATINNIGNVHRVNGQLDSALMYLQRSLAIYKRLENKRGMATSITNIGSVYSLKGDHVRGIKLCLEGLQYAREAASVEDASAAADQLYKAYKAKGNYALALEMHELYTELRDSIENEEKRRDVLSGEFEFQYHRKAAADSTAFAKQEEIDKAEIAKQDAELKAKNNLQIALFSGLFLLMIFGGFMYNRFKVTNKQKKIIEDQKFVVEEQILIIEEKHKEITDSIRYAKRIQEAILPSRKAMLDSLKNGFVFYLPKDVVAGDFYWLEHYKGKIYYAAADCTGHGVPGAMVSVVCSNALTKALLEEGMEDPGKLLDRTREIVVDKLARSGEEVKDGMDISVCALDIQSKSLQWSGANNPLFIINPARVDWPSGAVISDENNSLAEWKPNKQPIGKIEKPVPFTTHSISLVEGDTVYVFTDGYIDQFGGSNGKKFKSSNFKNLLTSIYDKPMHEQEQEISKIFAKWRGGLDQIDDVCVIGVRV
jgi:serine phosphatase RsbU (regulator of sigma subunit)